MAQYVPGREVNEMKHVTVCDTAFPLTRRTRKTRTKAKSTEHGAKAIIIAGTKSADSSEDVKTGAALNYKSLIFRNEFEDAVRYPAVFSTTSEMALP